MHIHNILFQLIYHVHLIKLHRPHGLLVHLAAYKRHFTAPPSTAYNFHATINFMELPVSAFNRLIKATNRQL